MDNRLEILDGLKAAKIAFQETLDFCKNKEVDYLEIFQFSHNKDTNSGICAYLYLNDFYAAHCYVNEFFGNKFYTNTITIEYDNRTCIEVTCKRVKWLDRKIKELEAMG